jgi:hypothetical protein
MRVIFFLLLAAPCLGAELPGFNGDPLSPPSPEVLRAICGAAPPTATGCKVCPKGTSFAGMPEVRDKLDALRLVGFRLTDQHYQQILRELGE